MTAGSDNHSADAMGPGKLAGVAFDAPLRGIGDYVDAILSAHPFALHIPCPAPPWTRAIRPDLPARWLDRNGEDTGADVMARLSTPCP